MLIASATGRRLMAASQLVAGRRCAPLGASMHTWPDPVSLQSIHEFLDEINYFHKPRSFVDIGLKHEPVRPSTANKTKKQPPKALAQTAPIADDKLDDLLELLSRETAVPELDYDDVLLEGDPIIGLATTQGIYRDLFGSYRVDREDISFTQTQAQSLDKFVPFYWITDLPFSRVNRHPKQPEPVKFFKPLVRISAKFIHNDPSTDQHLYAHTSYYGNHIPASEALQKPSIALDCHLLSTLIEDSTLDDPKATRIREKHFDNWTPGSLQVLNLTSKHKSQIFYSLLLLNLDYLHTDDNCNLHWLAANIQATNQDNANYDELCDYLPVHGIRGFGYSRYVFVLLQHEGPITSQKIDGFSLDARKFNLNSFMQEHQSKNIVPIGLSWFQTTWDESSNSVFHNYVDIKAPVYEHVQPSQSKRPDTAYPGRIPFNIYLDHARSKKDINQQVLLERLKQVDPFDYKDQYQVPRVPPTIHQDKEIPSWMNTVMFKKKNKIGYWRGLRPASATLPLNNNADLDHPIRPFDSPDGVPLEHPNEYRASYRKKLDKDLPISKPITEFTNVFIQKNHDIYIEKVKKMIEESKLKKSQPPPGDNKDDT